mmetsp:Transcript_78015/g.241859  ORF Transcript_78015/g.241859 Transcript_78015/m.241859 type:complete len:319 (-) Transcript_78015:119-1075(-)
MPLQGQSSTVFEQTPTSICCGMFTLRVGMRIVSLFTMFEGVCQLYVHLADAFSGEPVFRWGPAEYERRLQLTSGLVGAGAVVFGLLGLRSTRTCSPSLVRNFRRFQGCLLLWTALWFVLVGAPARVEYVSVPAVARWPLSRVPGLPTRDVVDPEWPDGKPTVCRDVADIKGRLAESLSGKAGRRLLLRGSLRRIYAAALRRVLTCRQTLRVFWSWCALAVLLRSYCICVTGYFLKVVRLGGDGVMMIGSLDDLDKPFTETASSVVLIREQVRSAFMQMDSDGNGRLSLEELLQYLEGSNQRFKGVSKAANLDKPGGRH